MLLWLLFFAFAIAGCKHEVEGDTTEHAYVAVPQVALRDRVATVYNKVGVVNNGDKVRILDRSGNKRFARVRAPSGAEGWIEMRYLVGQQIYDQFAALAKRNAEAPTQATAVARRVVNMHVQPARDSEKLYQIREGDKLDLLQRSVTAKSGMRSMKQEPKTEEDKLHEKDMEVKEPEEPASTPAGKTKVPAKRAKASSAVADPLEDWWLVRDNQKHVGWVLGRILDVEVPLEIAQYAEGQHIVAAFVINEVDDETEGKKVPQYVVLMSEPRDGMPFDYNQMRVFTWNRKRTRYETAFRDRFDGVLPFSISKTDFGKEGVLPVFIARQKDSQGHLIERKYKMNGVIVRRVTAPGEAPPARAGRRGRK